MLNVSAVHAEDEVHIYTIYRGRPRRRWQGVMPEPALARISVLNGDPSRSTLRVER